MENAMNVKALYRLAKRVHRNNKDLIRRLKKLAHETDQMAEALLSAADLLAVCESNQQKASFANWSFDHEIEIPF